MIPLVKATVSGSKCRSGFLFSERGIVFVDADEDETFF